MTLVEVPILRLPHGRDLAPPAPATAQAAGMDLRAAIAGDAPTRIEPGQRLLVPTGVAIALPLGHEAQVRPRSGLALEHGITVLNAPGTIDADYRGEIGVILINLGQRAFVLTRGRRIAQLVVAPVCGVRWRPATALAPSGRGGDGFGSTDRADGQAV